MVCQGPQRQIEGLCREYIGFVLCEDEELIRNVLNVGDSGTLIFDPPQDDLVPPGWKYQVKPPIPGYQYPGNLVLQVRRPNGDTRVVPSQRVPSLAMSSIKTWAIADASDSTFRRQIKCLNDIDNDPDAENLRRCLLAKDLSEKENHHLFDKIPPEVAEKIERFFSALSDDQRRAWEIFVTLSTR